MVESQFQREELPAEAYVLDLRRHIPRFNEIAQLPDDDCRTAALLHMQAEHNPWMAVHAIGVGYAAMRLAAIHFRKHPHLQERYVKGIARFRNGGTKHDIGKIGIDNFIWNTTDEHTSEMVRARRFHTKLGYTIANLAGLTDSVDFNMIMYHHEFANGTGHPDGLNESVIPLEAQIALVADAWQAISTYRPYYTQRRSPAEAFSHTLSSVFGNHEAGRHLRQTFVEFYFSGAWRLPRILDNDGDIHKVPDIGVVMSCFQQLTPIVENNSYLDLTRRGIYTQAA